MGGGINTYVFGMRDPINTADPQGTLRIAVGDVYLNCYNVMGRWLRRPFELDPSGAGPGSDGFEFDYGPGARAGSGFFGNVFVGSGSGGVVITWRAGAGRPGRRG